jgi:hypothetical protein
VTSYRKTIATAREKVAKAGARAFIARMEAIVSILEGADRDDILLLYATALTNIVPDCSDEPLDEFKAELLRALSTTH